MKRIPLLLAALASLLMVGSGSALASARHAAASPTNTSAPTITGTAATGATLSATSGAWNGATPISYAYQWQRCNSSGSSCGTISGATNQNYVVSNSDAGRTIRVQVTATNADGSNQALSGATGTIADDRRRSGQHEAAGPVRQGGGRPEGHRRPRALVGPEADRVQLPVAVVQRRRSAPISPARPARASSSPRARSARSSARWSPPPTRPVRPPPRRT